MNNYYNPYNRIHFYYSYLNSSHSDFYIEYTEDSIGYSINDLSRISNIPKEIVRQDIYLIFLWQDQNIYSDTESLPCIYFDQYIDNPTEEQFISGELDHYLLVLNTIAAYEIPVTFEEQKALELLKKDLEQPAHLHFPSITKLYRVKDSYRFHHNPHIINHLNQINDAINYQQVIKITYLSPKLKSKADYLYFSFLPVKIAYDSTDNLYYVLSIGKKNSDIRSYRIDRIIHLEPVNGISDYSPDLSFLMQIAPNVWGCNFSAVSDPKNLFHVKVRFFNVANVFNKVRKELSCRTNGQLYEKDGFLYYEDDVYGIDKFRSWIFSYGRAAIVLEPEALRTQIITSLKYRL